MELNIYQIDTDRDIDNIVFDSYERAIRDTGGNIDYSSYDRMFSGEVGEIDEPGDIDVIAANDEIRDRLKRSLSASDIVEYGSEGDMHAYYVDSIGFMPLDDFRSEVTRDLSHEDRLIRVLRVEPGREPYPVEVESTLSGLQKEVEGTIEVVYPFLDETCLICNEEGKINGMPLNRSLSDDNGKIYDIIAGPFLICGLTSDSFKSLDDETLEKYSKKFKDPEAFYLDNSGILRVIKTEEREQTKDDRTKEEAIGTER